MTRIQTLLAGAMATILFTAPTADAQILGGGVGGGVGGTVGGLGGTLGGGVNGTLTGPSLPRAPRAVRAPRVKPGAVVGGRVALPDVAVGVGVGDIDVGRRTAIIESGVAVLPQRDAVIYMDQQYTLFRDDLAGTGVTVERRGEAIVLQMPADVTFAFDRYDLQSRFVPVLARVAATLRRYPSTYVDVVGHADAIGTDDYNQRLSERRAVTVADFLTSYDAQPARMVVAGRGESEPIASNASIMGRAANRRVEIILYPLT